MDTVRRRSRLVVHLPPQLQKPALDTVRLFYRRLLSGLESEKYEIECDEGYGPRPKLDCLNLCYHTTIRDPHVINMKLGYLSEYFYFDDGGYSGWSVAAEDTVDSLSPSDEDRALHRAVHEKYVVARITKYPQSKTPSDPALKGCLLVLTQVQGDSVLELGRFKSQAMVSETLRIAHKHGMRAAVKLHPQCKDLKFAAFVSAQADLYKASVVDGNIHELLALADLVAVVNSGRDLRRCFILNR